LNVALIDAVAVMVNEFVFTVKVTAGLPSRTVTLAKTLETFVLLLESVTKAPPPRI
jgi:hypothetical protein